MSDRIAIVLLSGGLDSTTVLAIAQRQGFSVHALSFRYGQRHSCELIAAQRIALRAGVAKHVVVTVDLGQLGGSALTADIPVPKGRSAAEMGGGIPVTYVPARNTIFLSFALAYAEVSKSTDIFLGINAVDYSGYPDCRSEYLEAFQRLANLATRVGVEGPQPIQIHAPLIKMTKAEIIRIGLSLGVDYAQTSSCYDPASSGAPCRSCDACELRAEGFNQCGMPDPLEPVVEVKSVDASDDGKTGRVKTQQKASPPPLDSPSATAPRMLDAPQHLEQVPPQQSEAAGSDASTDRTD